MKIKRKQKFAMKTANESQAQKYYYKRIKIGALVLCALFLISCGTAVVLGIDSSKQDMYKLYNNATYYTNIFNLTTGSGLYVSSEAAFPKYDLPSFITQYAYDQTLSNTIKGRGKRLRVSPCAAIFDSDMNFVSSSLCSMLFSKEVLKKDGTVGRLAYYGMVSAPIPFQTGKECAKFTDEINTALEVGSQVTAEGYAYEHVVFPDSATSRWDIPPRYGSIPSLYPESVTIKGKDGSKKMIKLQTDYDLPSGMQKVSLSCNGAVKSFPLSAEASALSTKYLNKNTIQNEESVTKELQAKSNVFKSYYICVEKISLTPLGHSGKYNMSELYGLTPNHPQSTYPYYNSKSSKTLPSEEYYVVSLGTYSPFWLGIKQVETYSTVNFIDMALILFAGILLWTVTMLTLLRKRLRQIEQNRKDLIMSIAHEMKTPFGIVRLYGEKILITPDPETKEDYASDMMEEIDEMNTLLQNILDASRLDSGSLKLNKTSFIMNDAADDVIEGYTPLADDKNIKLTLNAAGQFPVEADNYRIKQVISNLLSNAIKNTPENGKIDITVKRDGKNTAVTVRNTGKPIPKEKLGRIWDAFYKHNEESDNSKSGAGLGLSIVKNIILLHGGFCGVENKADGVEFWFRI